MIGWLQELFRPRSVYRSPVLPTTRRLEPYTHASGTANAAGTVTIPRQFYHRSVIERANVSGGVGTVAFYRNVTSDQVHVGGNVPGTLSLDPPIPVSPGDTILAVISGAVAGTVFTVGYDGWESAG